jgi:hypothetical protein
MLSLTGDSLVNSGDASTVRPLEASGGPHRFVTAAAVSFVTRLQMRQVRHQDLTPAGLVALAPGKVEVHEGPVMKRRTFLAMVPGSLLAMSLGEGPQQALTP